MLFFITIRPLERDGIPSANARFTSSAATAALYVTHPDRRLSVREPAMADTQLFRENLPSLLWSFSIRVAIVKIDVMVY